jgi:hypothetical protein
VNPMERAHRTPARAAVAALLFLLCTADSGPVGADSLRRGDRSPVSEVRNSIRLSIKISGANRRSGRVLFYKSVARQAKNRPTVRRVPPSGR